MTTVASLRILLGLDSKDVRDGAGSVKSELRGVQTEAKKTQTAFDDIKRGIGQGLGISVGLGGFQAASQAARELTGFLTDAVDAARQDQESVSQLNASLKANVPLWNGVTAAIEAQIATAERLGFTDDEVRGSIQRLVAVTHDVNEAVKIQQTAMDLARFKNIDLGTATQALIRIEAGRYRGLADLGIQVKANATQTEALAAVQKVASGAAQAFGETSAGAAKEAAIAFDEAQESIGRGLLPVVTELSHGVRDVLAPALSVVGDHMDEITKAAAILGATLLTQTAIGFGASAVAAARLVLTVAPMSAAVVEAGAAFQVAMAASIETGAALQATSAASVETAAALQTTAAASLETAGALQATSAAALEEGGAMQVAAAGSLEAGAAATVATTATEGLAVGINTASVAAKGFIPILGLVAIGIEGINKPAVNDFLKDFNESIGAGGRAASITADQTKVASDAFDALASAPDEIQRVSAALEALRDSATGAAAAAVEVSSGIQTLTGTAATAATAADTHRLALLGEQGAALSAALGMKGLQTAAAGAASSTGDAETAAGQLRIELEKMYGIALSDADAALALARGLDAAGVAAQVAAAQIAAFNRTHPVNPSLPGGSADTQRQFSTETGGDQAALDERSRINREIKAANDAAAADAKRARDAASADATRGARKAASDAKAAANAAAADAKRAAADLARSQVDSARDAFSRMSDAAHKYFDDLHAANLKAIDDAQATADAQIEAQKRANLQPATDAEKRLRAVQQQRELARLQSDLAAADNPADRLRATQALSDFQAQARIDFLRNQADAANAILDDQKKAQDAAYADQKTAENARHQAQVNLFDEDLKALQKYVDAHPAQWKRSTDRVLAILKTAGVDFEKAGAENANAYIRGINKAFSGFKPTLPKPATPPAPTTAPTTAPVSATPTARAPVVAPRPEVPTVPVPPPVRAPTPLSPAIAAENDLLRSQVDLFAADQKALQEHVAQYPAEWKKATDGAITVLRSSNAAYAEAGTANANAYIRGINEAFAKFTPPRLPLELDLSVLQGQLDQQPEEWKKASDRVVEILRTADYAKVGVNNANAYIRGVNEAFSGVTLTPPPVAPIPPVLPPAIPPPITPPPPPPVDLQAYAEDLAALKDYLGQQPGLWQTAAEKVIAVLTAAGADYEKAGNDNADAYIRGVNAAFAGFELPTTPDAPTPAIGPRTPASTTPPAIASVVPPAIAASAGLVNVGGGQKGDVYLDGQKVGEFIEHYLAANASATTSGFVARRN